MNFSRPSIWTYSEPVTDCCEQVVCRCNDDELCHRCRDYHAPSADCEIPLANAERVEMGEKEMAA